MNVIFLKDLENDKIDAVIIAELSTASEIQLCIDRMKKDNDMYDWEDLVNCLPSDCAIYDRWSNTEKIYY